MFPNRNRHQRPRPIVEASNHATAYKAFSSVSVLTDISLVMEILNHLHRIEREIDAARVSYRVLTDVVQRTDSPGGRKPRRTLSETRDRPNSEETGLGRKRRLNPILR